MRTNWVLQAQWVSPRLRALGGSSLATPSEPPPSPPHSRALSPVTRYNSFFPVALAFLPLSNPPGHLDLWDDSESVALRFLPLALFIQPALFSLPSLSLAYSHLGQTLVADRHSPRLTVGG